MSRVCTPQPVTNGPSLLWDVCAERGSRAHLTECPDRSLPTARGQVGDARLGGFRMTEGTEVKE